MLSLAMRSTGSAGASRHRLSEEARIAPVWFAQYITDFSDQAVVLPVAIAIAVALYAAGWRRGAVIWSSVTVATFGLMLLLKLGFGACGHLMLGGQVESPSGHAAAAGVIYGSIFGLLVERTFERRALSFVVVLAIVAIVGTTRVLLGAHTVAEASLGATVGLGAALLMVRGAGEPTNRGPLALLLLPIFALVFLLHGLHLPAEAAIHSFAVRGWPLSLCRD